VMRDRCYTAWGCRGGVGLPVITNLGIATHSHGHECSLSKAANPVKVLTVERLCQSSQWWIAGWQC